MRTNKEQIKNFLHGIFFGVFVVGIMFATTGCPDKGKKNGDGYYNGRGYRGSYHYGDRGYGGYGSVEYIGIGQSQNGDAELVLEATIDGAAGVGGQVQSYLTGELYIGSEIPCMGGGYVEPGTYQLEPYNDTATSMVESVVGATFGVTQLSGFDYDDVTIRVNGGFVKPTGGGRSYDYDDLYVTVSIDYINGFYCGAILSIYP